MADQSEIEAFRQAFLTAGGPIGASDDAIHAGIEAVLAIVERDQLPLTVGQTAATAKLYSLAVLDEVRTATAKFLTELDGIKQRYVAELSPGPDQFKALIAMARQAETDTGSNGSAVDHG